MTKDAKKQPMWHHSNHRGSFIAIGFTKAEFCAMIGSSADYVSDSSNKPDRLFCTDHPNRLIRRYGGMSDPAYEVLPLTHYSYNKLAEFRKKQDQKLDATTKALLATIALAEDGLACEPSRRLDQLIRLELVERGDDICRATPDGRYISTLDQKSVTVDTALAERDWLIESQFRSELATHRKNATNYGLTVLGLLGDHLDQKIGFEQVAEAYSELRRLRRLASMPERPDSNGS